LRPFGFSAGGRWKVPSENLPDLFIYICNDLKSDYDLNRDNYGLSFGSLSVTLDILIDKMDIHEVPKINKERSRPSQEFIVYSSEYIEPHIFEAHERVRLNYDPNEDWAYQWHLQIKNTDRYLSKEMFVDNLVIFQAPDCSLEYSTDDLGPGLRSIAQVRSSEQLNDDGTPRSMLRALYLEMITGATKYLAEKMGIDKVGCKLAIRRGKAELRIPFRHQFRNFAPLASRVWTCSTLQILCRILIELMHPIEMGSCCWRIS
jgi:hypothetical protein